MTRPAIVDELKPLFLPESVAVIGATNNLTKWGFSTFASLKERYRGGLYPVNNKCETVLGIKAYPRVTDIPGPVDLAVIVVPAQFVPAVMRDCADKGVRAAVIISAGFAETGPEGKALQDKVLAEARRGGIRFVGGNCMGMWSARADLTAFMFPLPVTPGPLALVSQGGNVGGSVTIDAHMRGVGLSYYVSCGCTADIQIEDYVEYMGADDDVKVIMLYIEGIADGRRFIEKVRKVTARKPVIALKPGRTDAAARAISSHSGALSGSDLVYEAAFHKAGVIRVDTTIEMLDSAVTFLSQPLPKGRNVVITTPGGSYGVMCADACASRGIEVIRLPERALQAFNEVFPPRWSHGNPVDPAGDRNFMTYFKAPEVVLREPEVDALIFMGFGSFSGISAMLANAGGELNRSMANRQASPELAAAVEPLIEAIDSGDPVRIRPVIELGLKLIFGPVMTSRPEEIEEFLHTAAEALTTPRMLRSSFFVGMKSLFRAAAEGRVEASLMAEVAQLMEPMLGALIEHWIRKYNKPVLTTTFTEETSRMSESGHFPFPNAERAASALLHLIEYRERLEAHDLESEQDG